MFEARITTHALIERLRQGGLPVGTVHPSILPRRIAGSLALTWAAALGALVASAFLTWWIIWLLTNVFPTTAWPDWQAFFVTGLFLIVLACATRLYLKDAATRPGMWMICLLALMLTGKLLFIAGFSSGLERFWPNAASWTTVSLGLAIVTAATCSRHIFGLPIDRVLSSTATFLAIGVAALGENWFNLPGEYLFVGVIGLETAALLALIWRPFADTQEVALALALTLGWQLLFLLADETMLRLFYTNLITGAAATILGAGLAVLIAWAAGGLDRIRESPLLIAACGGAIVLGFTGVPGIPYATGLLIYGFACQKKWVCGIGALYLAVVIAWYYYDLDLTLLQKSGVLIASGLLLLLGGWIASATGARISSREPGP